LLELGFTSSCFIMWECVIKCKILYFKVVILLAITCLRECGGSVSIEGVSLLRWVLGKRGARWVVEEVRSLG
jgi:hypothetical protein